MGNHMTADSWDALERAIALAVASHHGQRDKAGLPYILHLLRVMQMVSDPVEKQAAVLHDYIEDVSGSVEELRQHAICEPAIQAIVLLSRPDQMSYCEYVIRLSSNPIATRVKLADLEDNYRLGRVVFRLGHQEEDAKRMQKYAVTNQFLSQTIDEAEYRSRMVGLE